MFDGGNGVLLGAREAEDGCIEALVSIRPDVHSKLEDKTFMQWFSFRSSPSSQSKCQQVRYVLTNASSASYPKAWPGTTVCFSYDAISWQRCLNTSFDAATGHLSWTFDHCGDGRPVHFSYFATYPYERALALVARCGAVKGVRVRTLGHSLQGREISYVSPRRTPRSHSPSSLRHPVHRTDPPSPSRSGITCGTGPLVAWVIHRQDARLQALVHFTPCVASLMLIAGSTQERRRDHFTAKAFCGGCSAPAATAASELLTAWPCD